MEGKVVENDLVMIFVSPTKRGRPWKPLGIVGAAVGFGKRPCIGVVLSRFDPHAFAWQGKEHS